MRFFGYDIKLHVRAARALPKHQVGDGLIEIMPPFGTNPPPQSRPFDGDLTTRAIHSDPRELWYLALPSKLSPKQVLQILRSALGGDLWQQWQLFTLMMDSWPTLRKCVHELRSAVAQTRFVVQPFTLPGKQPSPTASKKADLVTQAISGMKPDPSDPSEKGFGGLIYDLSDAFVNGLTMVEILWNDSPSWVLPRAAAWVHPRHYTFTTGGRVVVVDTNWRDYQEINGDKFLIGAYNSRSGSALGAGMLRPLAWDWSAVMYNREWMLEFAQRFGSPFRWATYKPGTPTNELNVLDDMLENMGNAGWGRFVDGTQINFIPPGTLGPQQPHVAIMDQADKHCQLLLLGQTLTTDVHDSGSRALGEIHRAVRRERVEEIAGWCATLLTEQLAPSICRLNFGNQDECPTIIADFTEQADPLKTAQVYDIFLKSGVPISAEEFYRENKLAQPQPGDKILVGGKLLTMTDADSEALTTPPQDGAGAMQYGEGQLSDELKAFSVIMARMSRSKELSAMPEEIRGLLKTAVPMLAQATADDLAHVREAVKAVIKANDEHFDAAAQELRNRLKEFVHREPKKSAEVLQQTMNAAFFNAVWKAAQKRRPLQAFNGHANGDIHANGENDTDKFAVVVAIRNPLEPEVLLVKRGEPPQKGQWASPGGHVEEGETMADAAKREFEEETGLTIESLSLLESSNDGAFFYAVVAPDAEPRAGGDAAELKWMDADKLPPLAFESNSMVGRAVEKVRTMGAFQKVDNVQTQLSELSQAVKRLSIMAFETEQARRAGRTFTVTARGPDKRILSIKEEQDGA